MYIDFFDLEYRPFAITPDMDFMYWSDSHRRTFDTLREGLLRETPVIMLTGQVGTGKTLLINTLINNPQLSEKFHFRLMSNLFGEASEMLQKLLLSLDRKPADPANMDTDVLVALQEIKNAGLTPLIIADEAQTLSPEGAEVLGRIAGSPENARSSILIVGQPELRGLIDQVDYQELKKHVGLSVQLSELQVDEIQAYIQARLMQAGSKHDVFTAEAVYLIHEKTKGVPRLINKLCEAMLFLAAQAGARTIDAVTAKRFLDDNIDPTTLALQTVSDARYARTSNEFALRNSDATAFVPTADTAKTKTSVPVSESLGTLVLTDAINTKPRPPRKWAIVGLAAGLAILALPFHPTVHAYLDKRFYGPFGAETLTAEIAELTERKRSIEQEILVAEDRLAGIRSAEDTIEMQVQTALQQIDELREKVAIEEAALKGILERTEKAAFLTMENAADLRADKNEAVQVSHTGEQIPNVLALEGPKPGEKVQDLSSLIKGVEHLPTSQSARFFNDAVDLADRRKMAIGYARAALGGHRRAARYLGQLYETGDGVAFSQTVAERWYGVAEGQQTGDRVGAERSAGNAFRETATPLFSVSEDKLLELVWDGDSAGFVVEFADADGDMVGRFETPLTAARLQHPDRAVSWRVRPRGSDAFVAWHEIKAKAE